MKKTYLLALTALMVVIPVLGACSKADKTIKVISYNIRMGTADDGE